MMPVTGCRQRSGGTRHGTTEGGPDLIFRRGRDETAIPWRTGATLGVGLLWRLFGVVPSVFEDDPSQRVLIRWTIVALVAIGLMLTAPPVIRSGKSRVAVTLFVVATAAIVVSWLSTS
jgi:hypothetical protein